MAEFFDSHVPVCDDLRGERDYRKGKNPSEVGARDLRIVWNEDIELEQAETSIFLSSNT